MTDRFRYYLRVRYGECDAQKVVFNARYGDYVDLATSEFFRAVGYGQAIASGEVDFQLVKQTVEWKAPARFDQVLEVSVSAKHLGNTSFTLAPSFALPAIAIIKSSQPLKPSMCSSNRARSPRCRSLPHSARPWKKAHPAPSPITQGTSASPREQPPLTWLFPFPSLSEFLCTL